MRGGWVRTLAVIMLLGLCHAAAAQGGGAIETVVFVRHGEKPGDGLGQLDCQGLNRAFALPAVIARLFGKPAAIFAPNPADQITDHGKRYDYVRPLATIEPAAIAFGLPVNANIGFSDADALRQALEQPGYAGAVVLVAWEHKQIEKIARDLMRAHLGDSGLVPDWGEDDFDSIYVLKIDHAPGAASMSFEHRQEALDRQPTNCPG